ncbi:MAG: hypothetical protein R3297_01505 [Desulfobulbales bacterium]|nr:hypothetical protein [Desulfobulbales bacterium]
MRKELIISVVIGAAMMLLTGCAGKDGPGAHADIKGKKITVASGDFFEACDKWEPGDKVNFSFTSSKPVMFNVHYHEKHGKFYAIKDQMIDKLDSSFIVQSKNIHCCFWKNNNDKYVTITYDMSVE